MKLLKHLISGEFLFAAFILSAVFKSALPPFPLDIIIFAFTVFIALKRLFYQPVISTRIIAPSILFGSLLLMIIFSYLYSSSDVYGIQKTTIFSIFTFWCFFGPFFLINDKESLIKFLKRFLVISILTSLYVLTDYFVLSAGLVEDWERFGVEGSNTLGLGRMAAQSVIVVIMIYLFQKVSIKQKLLAFLLLIPLIVVLFLTGARMALLSLLVAIIIFFIVKTIIIKDKKIHMNKNSMKVALYLSVIPIIMIPFYDYAEVMWNRLINLLNESGTGSYMQRVDLYTLAINVWSNNILLGDGIGSFAINFNGIDERYYPHNILLEVLSELGLVGFILFILLLATPFIIYNQLRSNYLQICVLLLFLYTFINANTTGDINDNRMMFTFLALMYMHPLFNLKKEEKGKTASIEPSYILKENN